MNTCRSVDSKELSVLVQQHTLAMKGGQPEMAVPLKAGGLRGLRPALQALLTKKKMRQLGCRTLRLHLVIPESDYSKIWFGIKGKERNRVHPIEVRTA